MLDTIFGLPVHPLIVHATVVIVPAAAIAVLLSVLWPRFRAWAGWGPLALAVAASVLAPLSTSSGESLEHRIGDSDLIEAHSELGDLLIWWAIPLVLLAAAGYWLNTFRGGRRKRRTKTVSIILTVLAVIVSIGILVQVALIGHSGAQSAWSDVASASSTTTTSPGDDD